MLVSIERKISRFVCLYTMTKMAGILAIHELATLIYFSRHINLILYFSLFIALLTTNINTLAIRKTNINFKTKINLIQE